MLFWFTLNILHAVQFWVTIEPFIVVTCRNMQGSQNSNRHILWPDAPSCRLYIIENINAEPLVLRELQTWNKGMFLKERGKIKGTAWTGVDNISKG